MATLKVHEVRCPECGELLDVDPGRKIGFCPYCGVRLHVEEESGANSFTYNYNEHKTNYVIDEAKIMHEQRKADESYNTMISNNVYIIVSAIIIIALFVIGGIFFN